jgi:hypothetical protein
MMLLKNPLAGTKEVKKRSITSEGLELNLPVGKFVL